MSDAHPAGPKHLLPDLPTALLDFRRRKRKVAKAKAEAAEVKFLNIVAMVDVLTILLIFLLKSVSVSSQTAPAAGNMTLPFSTTQELPVNAVKVFVTKERVIVEDVPVAEIKVGIVRDIDLAPDNPNMIPKLRDALDNWIRLAIVQQDAAEQALNLEILADKDMPYQVLMQVLFSAGQSNVKVSDLTFSFTKYRLLVMRSGT